MNFEERTNAIGTLLRETILPRYRRPEHLDDVTASAELADMVSDLNAAWPVTAPDRFAAIAERLAREIRRVHSSRTWPTIAVMLKALDAALVPPKPVSGEFSRPEDWHEDVLRWQLRDWRDGKRPINPGIVTRERCMAIGMSPGEAARAVAFAADLYNAGVHPDLTHDDRLLQRERYALTWETADA